MKRICIISFLIIFSAVSFLAAGNFKLDSGEKVKGKLLRLNAASAMIQTEYGMVQLPSKKITDMDFSGESFEYVFTLKDASVVKGNLISFSQGTFVINTTAGIINISADNISDCIETGYANKVKQDLKAEEMNRENHFRLSAGYGLLMGSLADKYYPGVHVDLGYDRAVAQEGFLQKLRLGVAAGYENLAARSVSGVSVDVITMMVTARYVFSFTSEGFWSLLSPFVQIGGGGALLRLNYASGTNEAGLDPALFASVGLNFTVTSWLDISLFCDYEGIMEPDVSLQEVWFGGGVVFKL